MDLEKIQAFREEQDKKKSEAEQRAEQRRLFTDVVRNEPKVEVKNFPNIATSGDVDKLSSKIDDFTLTTFISQNGTLTEIIEAVKELSKMLNQVTAEQQTATKDLASSLTKSVATSFPQIPQPLKEVGITNLADLSKYFNSLSKELRQSIGSLKLNPQINVASPEVKVEQQTLDIQPLLDSLDKVQTTLKSISNKEQPKFDVQPLLKATKDISRSINSLSFPVPNYILPFKNQSGAATQAQLNDDGTLPISHASLTQPTTPTLANVTMTGSSVTLRASNTARRNLMIFNDSGVVVYVKLGSSASSTSFTVKMVDQSYYELPDPVYTGIVTALGASGDVRVTEVV